MSVGDVIASSVALVGFVALGGVWHHSRRRMPASRRIPVYRIAGDLDDRPRLQRVRGRGARAR